MDWIQSIFIAVISGLIVGLPLAMYKVDLERKHKNADEAINLKITNVTDKLEAFWEDLTSTKFAMEECRKEVGQVKTKLEVVATELRFLGDKFTDMNSSVKEIRTKVTEGFGRVIRKGV